MLRLREADSILCRQHVACANNKHISRLILISLALLLAVCRAEAVNPVRRAALDPPPAEHSLINNDACSYLHTLCAHQTSNDNIAVLECVSTLASSQLEALPDKCQHAIWQEQQALLTTRWLQQPALQLHCGAQRTRLLACGNNLDLWVCLRNTIEHLEHGNSCRAYIRRVESLLFPDQEALSDFFAACNTHVQQLECGRLNIQHKTISQLETIQCLQESGKGSNAADISEVCRTAIAHVEMRRADLEFFEICAVDLQRLCGLVIILSTLLPLFNPQSFFFIYDLFP